MQLLAHVVFLLTFCCSAAVDVENSNPSSGFNSPAENSNPSSGFNSPTEDEVSQIVINLLRSCFDPSLIRANGYPRGSDFTIKARDGFRDVELTFEVYGDENKCKLEWDSWLVPRGRIRSVHYETREPVLPVVAEYGPLHFEFENVSLMSHIKGITIDIYGNSANPHWELTSYQPHGLISDRFIISFLSQALYAHSVFANKAVYLRMNDQSPYRELSWLWKGSGRTYLEFEWNMEYECIRDRMNLAQRLKFYEHSKRIGETDVQLTMLTIGNFNPIPNAWSWENRYREISPLFIDEMNNFIQSITQGDHAKLMASMKGKSTKQVVREFITFWKDKHYSLKEGLDIIQSTFMFFYRDLDQFDIIARQVLSGYDDSCYSMQGIPIDKYQITFELQYIYRSGFVPGQKLHLRGETLHTYRFAPPLSESSQQNPPTSEQPEMSSDPSSSHPGFSIFSPPPAADISEPSAPTSIDEFIRLVGALPASLNDIPPPPNADATRRSNRLPRAPRDRTESL